MPPSRPCFYDNSTDALQTFPCPRYTFTVKNNDAPRRLISKSAG